MKAKFQVLLVVLMIIGVTAVAAVPAAADDSTTQCPSGQGYWANNTDSWPVTSLQIGTQFYTQAELLALQSGSDASTILVVQLAAAKLNLAAGADATPISAAMLQADNLLAQYGGKLPYNVDPSSPEGQAMTSLAGLLDAYNSGQLLPACAAEPTEEPTAEVTAEPTEMVTPEPTAEVTTEPGDTSVTIIIEGPVQAININIITIYDTEIEIDEHDPILSDIHVGDFVRVEGNLASGSTVIVVIPVVIYVVNVNVIVTNGGLIVWNDDGNNCQNPPPPWAPANGWRRRCENRPTTIIITGGSGNDQGMGMGDD